jgi:hypothetical protein
MGTKTRIEMIERKHANCIAEPLNRDRENNRVRRYEIQQ